MNGGKPIYTSDNLTAVPDWVYRVDSPPEVPCDHRWVTMDGPTYCEKCGADTYRAPRDWEPAPLTRDRSRDIALLAIAGMVIIAIAAYIAGTRA